MTVFPPTNQVVLRQAVSATIDALFAEECVEVMASDVTFARAAAIGIHGGTEVVHDANHDATVIVRIDDVLSRSYAAEMFDVAPDDLADNDIDDALLEMTNVIGGASKTAIDSPCMLSLPAIVDVVKASALCDETFAVTVRGGAISVTVLAGDCELMRVGASS